ncbi:MAG: type IVB secretion system apparatus protein IcmL/DotI [Pseudomonadota bacterium]|jgi:intracellular multiplication protein IcmL|nr:type IV secretion protein IcmL [Pseudomonadota bacterium]QKK05580.1 MAG: type IVB secretion system apparatus protein IcmL/DotI [Pseudomonadota bacterium]|tara:strand:+ start:2557 stop:3342 length:786 start_codon:yes stop_codon:yes gene_type:complete
MEQQKQNAASPAGSAQTPAAAPAGGGMLNVKSKGVQGASARGGQAKAAPAQSAQNTSQQGLEIVLARSAHYQAGFKNMLRVVVFESLAILGLVAALIIYMNVSKPHDIYFATTHDGRQIPLVPLNQPNMQTPALLSWAAQAASEIMTFGFNDYQQRFQKSSRHFTPEGWEKFLGAMRRSRIIESVEGTQQIVTAVPRSAPILTGEGLFNGRYRWLVQLSLLVTYQSGQDKKTTTMTVYLTIERVSTVDSPNGLGISQWIGL